MSDTEYYIGQIFTEIYPPEAAEWCNSRGDCYIAEIKPLVIKGGTQNASVRRFQITAIPAPSLEEVREAKLAELASKFDVAGDTAHCMSSLGFEIDANPTSDRDITGVLVVMDDESTTQFCDYYNEFHTVTKAQMQTIQREIILNGQYL
ncbi:MAG: hypothetical protein IKE23_12235, partial [Exiguobacterium sp.]|nr:hypothetical protein [Exiguobacterium sp.]